MSSADPGVMSLREAEPAYAAERFVAGFLSCAKPGTGDADVHSRWTSLNEM